MLTSLPMKMIIVAAIVATLAVVDCDAFVSPNTFQQSVTTVTRSHPSATQVQSASRLHAESDRRSFVTSSTAAIAAGIVTSTFGIAGGGVPPANAFGGAIKRINSELLAYGLPLIDKVPDGFSPLLEVWGKGRNRSPLLVEFVHPSDWVVTLPSQDNNGEEGTIQAGEYAKGDTATLFILPDSKKVQNVASQPKEFFQNAIIKAITQKGDNVYQNFKLGKIEPTKVSGQDYVLVDFKYELLTGAGFTVDRVGVASVTSEGDGVQLLWTATIRQRYKKLEPNLRTIASSFRCYSEGLKFNVPSASDDDFA